MNLIRKGYQPNRQILPNIRTENGDQSAHTVNHSVYNRDLTLE